MGESLPPDLRLLLVCSDKPVPRLSLDDRFLGFKIFGFSGIGPFSSPLLDWEAQVYGPGRTELKWEEVGFLSYVLPAAHDPGILYHFQKCPDGRDAVRSWTGFAVLLPSQGI